MYIPPHFSLDKSLYISRDVALYLHIYIIYIYQYVYVCTHKYKEFCP